MVEQVFESIDPNKLKNHPLNAEIYGTEPDADFIASVKEKGIIAPIIVTKDHKIISGHKRRQAAIIAGLKSVRIVVNHTLTDPLDIEDALIHANAQREKTTVQKTREYDRLKRNEEKRAAIRKAATQPKRGENVNSVLGEDKLSSPKKRGEYRNSGKSSDIAAEAVGMAPATAEKALKVVEAIDEATASGSVQEAEELAELLNQNVSAAHRKLEEKKADEPTLDDHIKTHNRVVTKLMRDLGNVYKGAEAHAETCAWLDANRLQELNSRVESAKNTLRAVKAADVCPYCNGEKCKKCRETGWVNKTTLDSAPKQ